MVKATKRQKKIIQFSRDFHNGQVRRYTGDDYFNHCLRVAKLAAKSSVPYGFEIGICHDLLEDTPCTVLLLSEKLIEFGYNNEETELIVTCTINLTDVYTPVSYPNVNRKIRKELESKRLFDIDPISQSVKYCDLIDNTHSIVMHDKRFAVKYLLEAEFMLSGMNKGNQELYERCSTYIVTSKEYLKEYFEQPDKAIV